MRSCPIMHGGQSPNPANSRSRFCTHTAMTVIVIVSVCTLTSAQHQHLEPIPDHAAVSLVPLDCPALIGMKELPVRIVEVRIRPDKIVSGMETAKAAQLGDLLSFFFKVEKTAQLTSFRPPNTRRPAEWCKGSQISSVPQPKPCWHWVVELHNGKVSSAALEHDATP